MNNYANKLDNLKETDTPLATCNLSRLNQGETENLNGLVTTNKTESVSKISQQKPWTRCLPRWILPNIKEKLILICLKLFQTIKMKEGSKLVMMSALPWNQNQIKTLQMKITALCKIDGKIFNKILVNQIQQYINRSYIMMKWDLFLTHKVGLISVNQLTWYTTNKIKDKNYMILTYGKNIWQKSISIYDKNSQQSEDRVKMPQHNKAHVWQTYS